jgi:hypothetical protein
MRAARAILWLSSALAVFLAFAWPFVVSGDPASAEYKRLALGTLWGLLGAIAWVVIRKLASPGQR